MREEREEREGRGERGERKGKQHQSGKVSRAGVSRRVARWRTNGGAERTEPRKGNPSPKTQAQAQAQALPGPIDSRLTALAGVALAADDLLDGEAVDGVVLRLVEARHADGHAGGAGVPPARTARVGAAVAGGGSGRSRRVLEEGGKHGAVVVADAAAERRAAARGDDGAVAVVVLAGRAAQLEPLGVLCAVLLDVGGLGRDGRDGRRAGRVGVAAHLVAREDDLGRRGRGAGGDRLAEAGGAGAGGGGDRRAGSGTARASGAAAAGVAAHGVPAPVHEGLDGLAPLHLRQGPVREDGLDGLAPLRLLRLGHGAAALLLLRGHVLGTDVLHGRGSLLAGAWTPPLPLGEALPLGELVVPNGGRVGRLLHGLLPPRRPPVPVGRRPGLAHARAVEDHLHLDVHVGHGEAVRGESAGVGPGLLVRLAGDGCL